MEQHPVFDLKFQGRCLIEASAGTGKTWSIAKLFIRAILERRLLPCQILVVTFTNAATKELSERLYSELIDCEAWMASHGAVFHDFYTPWAKAQISLDYIVALNWVRRCLHSFDEAAISTLQSFCESVVARYSVELGIDLVAKTEDAITSRGTNGVVSAVSEVYREQVEFINALDDQDKAAYLLVALGSHSNLVTQVFELLNRPAIVPEVESARLNGSAQPTLSEARAQLLSEAIYTSLLDLRVALSNDNVQALVDYGNAYFRSAKPAKTINAKQFNDALAALESVRRGGIVDVKCIEALTKLVSGMISKSKYAAQESPETLMVAADLPAVKAVRDFWPSLQSFIAQADEYHQALVVDAHHRAMGKLLDGENTSFDSTSLSFSRTILLVAHGLVKQPSIAHALGGRYPIALVDEFQDTDPQQAAILNAVYSASDLQRALIMVGDPKQAIYNFRGADVYAYLGAKNSAAQIFSLNTNQRSVPKLVSEVNEFFSSTAQAFDIDGIDFNAVLASERHAQIQATMTVPAFTYVKVPVDADKSLPWIWCAHRIAALVAAGTYRPNDFAVLVRSNQNAKKMASLLSELGVPSRLESKELIWSQPIARQITWFLEGVFNYNNPSLLKKALMTPFAEWVMDSPSVQEPVNLIHVRALSDRLLTRFSSLRAIWISKGLAALWATLGFDRNQVPQHWSESDIRQVIELALANNIVNCTPEKYLSWLRAKIDAVDNAATNELAENADKRRSEPATSQVEIVTIHAAKGLQYKVVFLPDIFSKPKAKAKYRLGAKEYSATFYERNLTLKVNLQSDQFQDESIIEAAQREFDREEARLAYVALTRAEQACYMFFNEPKPKSATAKASPERRLLTILNARLSRAEAYVETCAVEGLNGHPRDTPINDAIAMPVSKVQLPSSQIRAAWSIDSFTALAKRSENEKHGDAPESALFAKESPQAPAQSSLFDVSTGSGHDLSLLPKGAHTGECLHAILEKSDWQRPMADAKNLSEIEFNVNRYGLSLEKTAAIAQWLDSVIATPIVTPSHLAVPAFSLKDIDPTKQLREWRFDVLQSEKHYLRGFVDLVFEHGNRFFVVDYKSNWLGPDESFYSETNLSSAMALRQYDLQARIYAAALKRFLAARLGESQVKIRFGGVLYLYLRAMRPDKPGQGVVCVV